MLNNDTTGADTDRVCGWAGAVRGRHNECLNCLANLSYETTFKIRHYLITINLTADKASREVTV
jgi:hypothetical protein